jgi:hypothetical protein
VDGACWFEESRATQPVKEAHLGVGERDERCGDVLSYMGRFRTARNRQDHWAAMEQPSQRNLTRCRSFFPRKYVQCRIGFRQPTRCEGMPRNEANSFTLTETDDLFAASLCQIIQVLDCRYGEPALRGSDLLDGDLAQSRVAEPEGFEPSIGLYNPITV